MKKLILYSIILFSYSCFTTETEIIVSKTSILEQRKKLNQKDSRSIGNSLDEFIDNLIAISSYQDFLEYVPRESFKSNIKIKEIGKEFFIITEDLWNFEVKPTLRIGLSYIVKNDTIRFAIIDNVDLDSLYFPDNHIIIQDNKFIQSVVSEHNKKFNASQNVDDFIKAFGKSKIVTFMGGYAGAAMGNSEKDLICDIQNGCNHQIEEYLKSIDPAYQAIGVVGVNQLQKLNLSVSQKNLHFKSLIVNSNHEFHAYMACTIDIVSMNEYLSLKNWDYFEYLNLDCDDCD